MAEAEDVGGDKEREFPLFGDRSGNHCKKPPRVGDRGMRGDCGLPALPGDAVVREESRTAQAFEMFSKLPRPKLRQNSGNNLSNFMSAMVKKGVVLSCKCPAVGG